MRRRTGSPSAASTPASRTESSSESARSESGGQHRISVVGPSVTVASVVLTTVDVSYTLTSTVINLKDVAMSRVQLALNVSDLDDAVRFYSALFGTGPAKVRPRVRQLRSGGSPTQARPHRGRRRAGFSQPSRSRGRHHL